MNDAVIGIAPLGLLWPTVDPFLLCVHHDDRYPKGNGRFGPAASLAGHRPGRDFFNTDGWRMYHGSAVPGFPAHPHRGFETVTIVRQGWIDHADSLGAAARYGPGDVQWLCAGRGVVHAEMFPLLDTAAPNRLEFFQIWLNLPARSKFAAPRFAMLWSEDVPRVSAGRPGGAAVALRCIAGRPPEGGDCSGEPFAPPADSWAAAADNEVAIWTLRLDPGATWTLPAARDGRTRRLLYFFAGQRVRIGGHVIGEHAAIEVTPQAPVELFNAGAAAAEFLLLQGRPIGEPVVQQGPFVMNTEAQLRQAFADFQHTGFGGWPWSDAEPVHGPDPRRFVRQADRHD